MALTRDDIRDSVERAGDEHWGALRGHHEDAYPNPKPTPGDVCKGEAERLNQLGLGNAPDFELLETRVERVGEEVRLTGFGNFRVTQTAARTGRNPRTGETLNIAAGKRPTFTAGSRLKSAVGGK